MIQAEKIVFNSIIKFPDILKKLTGINGDFFSNNLDNKILKLIKSGKTLVADLSESFPKSKQGEVNQYLNKCYMDIYEVPISQLQDTVNNILKDKLEKRIVKLINAELKSGVYEFDKIEELRIKIEELNSENKPDYICLEDIEPEGITWLWYNRFPAGCLSILAGDPGVGKSILAVWIAAQITRGNDWPDLPDISRNDPRSVVILAAEDGLADTIRVRADEAGADCAKITVLNPREFSLDKIKTELEYLIKKIPDIRLVILDPLDSYLQKVKSGNENIGLRSALIPIVDLAGKHRISIIAVHHLNKDSGKKSIYRVLGSIAYQGVPRSTWCIERDPDDTENKRRFFAPVKTNLSKNPTTLAFSIDGPIGKPAITFEPDPVEINSDELLADEEAKDNYSAREDAVHWIKEALKDGPVEAAIIKRDSKENMIAEATLNRAKKSAGVNSYRNSGRWFWELKC